MGVNLEIPEILKSAGIATMALLMLQQYQRRRKLAAAEMKNILA